MLLFFERNWPALSNPAQSVRHVDDGRSLANCDLYPSKPGLKVRMPLELVFQDSQLLANYRVRKKLLNIRLQIFQIVDGIKPCTLSS
jgi:hypothetical protein